MIWCKEVAKWKKEHERKPPERWCALEIVYPILTDKGIEFCKGKDWYPVEYKWDWPRRKSVKRIYNWRYE